MSANTLTPDKLVLLAEYCEKEIHVHANKVFLEGTEPNGPCCSIQWRPDEDAKQRDELVEALQNSNWLVILYAKAIGRRSFSVRLIKCKCRHGEARCYEGAEAHTPGLAVCRAALKVI